MGTFCTSLSFSLSQRRSSASRRPATRDFSAPFFQCIVDRLEQRCQALESVADAFLRNRLAVQRKVFQNPLYGYLEPIFADENMDPYRCAVAAVPDQLCRTGAMVIPFVSGQRQTRAYFLQRILH